MILEERAEQGVELGRLIELGHTGEIHDSKRVWHGLRLKTV